MSADTWDDLSAKMEPTSEKFFKTLLLIVCNTMVKE